MRPRAKSADPFLVGVVVLLLIAAGTYLGFTKRLPWAGEWQVKAVVSDAQELSKGAQVRIAGIAVGRVTSVRRGPAGTSVVTMAINAAGRPLHRDATLTIRPRLFLEGNFFVDLRPGSPSAPELEEGQTIPLGQTATAVRIDSVLRILESDARNKVRDGLREYAAGLADGGARALNRSLPVWEPALLGTARTMAALRGERGDDLSSFLRESSRIASGLARDEDALGRLVTGFARTMRATATHRTALAATVHEFNDLATHAPPALQDIERALPAVRRLAIAVRPALREAPETFDDARPFLRQVEGLVQPSGLAGLERDLGPALREVRALAAPLSELLGPVGRVSRCVSTNIVPVLTSHVDDGELSTGDPVWQEFLRGAVGLTSASQNFDGNGADLRYSLGVGDQTVSLGSGPSSGDLFARTERPILGSRPQMPSKRPPQRPDVPCAGQPRPRLTTEASPAPVMGKAPPLKLSGKQTRALRRLIDGKTAARR